MNKSLCSPGRIRPGSRSEASDTAARTKARIDEHDAPDMPRFASAGRTLQLRSGQAASAPTRVHIGCNCSDSHHMKAAGPDIWFYRPAKKLMNTAWTVERKASIPWLGARIGTKHPRYASKG